MIECTINGQVVQTKEGQTIYEAAANAGIKIPTLCHDERLKPHGSCRICVVEVAGARSLMASCSTPAANGMVIQTESEAVVTARKEILDLILANHPLDCLTCEKAGRCTLQDLCFQYDIEESSFEGKRKNYDKDTSNEFFVADQSKCILCGKCVYVCSQVHSTEAICFVDRGFETHVGTPFGMGLSESTCVSCGNCVSVCPVGALLPKRKEKYRYWETREVKTTCAYCGVGCQMNLLVKDNKVVEVLPVKGAANEGLLCVKGRFAHDFIGHPDRLTTPLIRRNGTLEPASWEEALNLVTEKIQTIRQEHGADAIAGFSSARVTNEENYLMNKLMRGAIGTNNIDHCARLCHASTVAGLATTLGSGAMTNPMADVKNAEVIFITGSNTTEAHPVMGAYVRQARKAGSKLIVADPREIELAKEADLFLKIRPGSSVALSNAMIQVILQEKLENKTFIEQHTEGFDQLVAAVAECTPEWAETVTGVPAETVRQAARIYATSNASSIIYSMGITQHVNGTENVMSLSNLALVTGNLGKAGAGVNPLRGQNNVQGACDMGALPNVMPSYQPVNNPETITRFEETWGVALPQGPGLTVTQAIPAAAEGVVKMLYAMGENPMISDPDTHHVKAGLEKAFLVVQDIFLTETAELADVVLPAAVFAEKEGTFTNTERRVQRVRQAVMAPGEARPDWWILMQLLNRLGLESVYREAKDVFEEIRRVAPSYAGISYDRIEEEGISWPCPSEDHKGTPILHVGKIAQGAGLFKPVQWHPSPELGQEAYPQTMTTGRILYHFHTRTMTAKSPGIEAIAPENYVEIHPEMAASKGIQEGDLVAIASPRGEIRVKARITDRVDSQVVFVPFHWSEGANVLTNGEVLDPYCKIPGYKVTGVSVEKAADIRS
ncbi:formate dehydrogenase subunit alpha [Anoxynatronum buryatiense]|uniref:NAD-dependent formate dehydrogenase catalytic subunit n=1 Tax=Anoxynatronum buryatiense TaxID=489973 RepID=A0AA45WUE0_9CLOT|nr:formate dehydrogenase subunit alpha [Anoxynatronum buryatiense]SMP43451.1 NAD-dependent formate dehydrogenase catalytic subunit [Anoxynatronum buryatiense]